MLGGHILYSVLWAGLTTCECRNGFTAPPLSLFAPHFSHPSSLFYFKTDESSVRIAFSFFFFFRFVRFSRSYLRTRAASYAHLYCPESQICQSHLTHLARQIAAPERRFWSVLAIYTVHLHTTMESEVLYVMCGSRATYIKTVWGVWWTRRVFMIRFHALYCIHVSAECLKFLTFLPNGSLVLQLDICCTYIFLYVVQLCM